MKIKKRGLIGYILIIACILCSSPCIVHAEEDYSYDYDYEYDDEKEEDEPLYLYVDSCTYGSKTLTGRVESYLSDKSLNGTKVYFKYKGKQYTTRCNSKGEYKFNNLPLIKHGTDLKIYAEKEGFISDSTTCTISFGYNSDIWHYYSYPSNKGQKGYVKNAHRGDILKITIGGHVYKKTIKNNRDKIAYSFNTGMYPAGTTIRFQLTTKFGKKLVDYKDIVYKKKKIYVGDTKEDVLLTVGFRKPTRKTYTAYSETWWYGSSKYVQFDENGRVSNWYL